MCGHCARPIGAAARVLEVTVAHAEPTPRPAEVVSAIRSVFPELPDEPVLATRLVQGVPGDTGVRAPF